MSESETLSDALPKHLGFILDGNRRWAKMHSLPVFDGHLAGYNALKEVARACFDAGIPYVTLYVFSTENWKRDKSEVSNIMKLMLRAVGSDLKELIDNKVRVRFLGGREGLSPKILHALAKAEEQTVGYTGSTLAFCFNYGGKQEIVDAARQCVQDGLDVDDINEQAISERLYAPDIPPIDMIIRTSGEQRLSNFMLWRADYSELLFLEKYWPDMTKQDVTSIIKEYQRRQRRLGA